MTRNDRLILLLATASILVIYITITLLVTVRQFTPTGDEPHYLMITHSLVVDRDISLLNNYREQQYRFVFYDGLLPKRTTASGDNKRELPTFPPGMAVFLAPFYSLAFHNFRPFLVPFLRTVVCGVAAIGIYHLLALARTLTESRTAALIVVATAALSSPLVMYSNQFYPEIFAFTLLVIGISRLLSSEKQSATSVLVLAFIPGLLLWLHPKYILLAFVIFGVAAFQLRRNSMRLRLIHLLVSTVVIGSFFLFLRLEYASWSPNRMYGGFQKRTTLLELIQQEGVERFAIMARMFAGFWLDERFGILPYAPFYVTFFPALLWVFKNRLKQMVPVLTLFVIHYVALCWGAPLGGFAPPSRHFVVMLPMILLPIAFLYSQWSTTQKYLFSFLQLVGLIIASLMFKNYRAIFANVTWRNPDGVSPFWNSLYLDQILPNLIATQLQWGLIAAWLAAIICLSFVFYPTQRHKVS